MSRVMQLPRTLWVEQLVPRSMTVTEFLYIGISHRQFNMEPPRQEQQPLSNPTAMMTTMKIVSVYFQNLYIVAKKLQRNIIFKED